MSDDCSDDKERDCEDLCKAIVEICEYVDAVRAFANVAAEIAAIIAANTNNSTLQPQSAIARGYVPAIVRPSLDRAALMIQSPMDLGDWNRYGQVMDTYDQAAGMNVPELPLAI